MVGAWRTGLKAVGVCGGLLVAACASGPHYDGATYRSDEVAFRVGPAPADWRRIDSQEAALAFRDDPHAATVAVGARCGKEGDDVPLTALTHHLFLQFTGRQLEQQDEVRLDGRAALHTRLRAELDGVAKDFSVYVLKKDGCVYDFIRIVDVGAAEEGEAEFQRFVASFSTLPGSGLREETTQ